MSALWFGDGLVSANSRQSWHVNDRLLPEQFQTVAEQLVNELKVIRFA
jgi:hypothetical protein